MKLWDDAIRMVFFGTELYAFGVYCAIGALCATLALAFLCHAWKLKKGAAALTGALSLALGLALSRLVFCLLNMELGAMAPLDSWIRISTGGWTMFGMIGGVMLAAWISGKILGEKPRRLLDAVSVALPLAMAAEKLAEGRMEGFDISRPLKFPVSGESFLTVQDEYGLSFLATHRIAAIAAVVLFLILVFSLLKANRRDGELWIRFLLICGAGGVLMESLRYDHFLEYSFVRFEQVFAALMLVWGVVLAARQGYREHRGIFVAALVLLPLTVGGCIAIEFGLDRTEISHILQYAVMIALLAATSAAGCLLLRGKGTDQP